MEVTLSEAQNGAQLPVYMDDVLVVRLIEACGDGYRWALGPVDDACLEMIEHRYEPARTGGGASVWRFRPKRAGRMRLTLTTPRDRFAVELDIR